MSPIILLSIFESVNELQGAIFENGIDKKPQAISND
jgi:hypothetical protein